MEEGICRPLEWDSDFFGLRIARANVNRLSEEVAQEILTWCKIHAIDCLYFLADADDAGTVRLAEERGFRLVDIRVTLARPVKDLPDAEKGPRGSGIRCHRPEDLQALRAIARRSHLNSRFYFDSNFPKDRCDALYETWIEKSCSGYADVVMVAEHDGEPAGYVSCHLDDREVGRIGLFAVRADLQGKGLGRGLVDVSVQWFYGQGRKEIIAVTQGRSVQAQRLYQRRGFLTQSVQLWYHRWFRTLPVSGSEG